MKVVVIATARLPGVRSADPAAIGQVGPRLCFYTPPPGATQVTNAGAATAAISERHSRLEAFYSRADNPNPVMHPIFSSLPEFHHIRRDEIPAPVRRHRNGF